MTIEQPENDAQEHAEGVFDVREKTSVHDRLLTRTCEWCGRPVDYSGIGRRPKYCSDAHRKRASELRRAQARADRPVEDGGRSKEPVREVIERTETITRTVVRRAPAHSVMSPTPQSPAPAYELPQAPEEWWRTLQALHALAASGSLPEEWRGDLARACEVTAERLRGPGPQAPPTAPVPEQLSRAERRRRERAERKKRR